MRITLKECAALLAECQQQFRFKYPEKRLFVGITPEQVREDLKRYKMAYLQLLASPMANRAQSYAELRDAIERGVDPSLLTYGDRYPQPSQAWEKVQDLDVSAPRLPNWLKGEVRNYIDWLDRMKEGWTSPVPTPLTPDWLGRVLRFTARCYLDRRVRQALAFLRLRWAIHANTDSTKWYNRMNEADAKYERTRKVDRVDPRTSDFSRRTFSEPQLRTAGAPINHFLSDLRTLVRLVGGNPRDDVWVRWCEGLLWDFRGLPWPGFAPPEPKLERWRGYPRAAPTNMAKSGRVWAAPVFRAPDVRSDEGGVTVRFGSKYLVLDGVSDELRRDVVAHACDLWGDYEEPPTLYNIEKELRALLLPLSSREVMSLEGPAERYGDDRDISELAAFERKALQGARKRAYRASHKVTSRGVGQP